MEHMKNSFAIVKEWMEGDEALVLASELGLDSNGELKSISSINMIHPSSEEALDETNSRGINSWEILEDKTSNECHRHAIIDTNLLPIDTHEVEFEKRDQMNEHENYFINTPSNPCSDEKSSGFIGLSNVATHEIINPLMLPVPKNFKRVVVDVYVYHKYCRSGCNLDISAQRLMF
jgi:hypothetical protein